MQREQRQACLQPTPTTCNAPLFCRYTSQVFLKPGHQVISKVYDSTLFDHLDSTWDFAVGPAPTSTWLTFSVDFGFKSPLYRHIAAVFFEEVGCTALSVFCVCVELDVERVPRASVQRACVCLHTGCSLRMRSSARSCCTSGEGASLQYLQAGWDRLLADMRSSSRRCFLLRVSAKSLNRTVPVSAEAGCELCLRSLMCVASHNRGRRPTPQAVSLWVAICACAARTGSAACRLSPAWLEPLSSGANICMDHPLCRKRQALNPDR